MQPNPQPQRVSSAAALPSAMQQFMPFKGEYAARKVGNDKILYVGGLEKIDAKVRCHVIARYMLHAAQDGGFGIICILRGPNHKHEFKVLDMVRKTKKWSGPPLVGFTGKFRDDCWLDERKKIWVLGAIPRPDAQISTP